MHEDREAQYQEAHMMASDYIENFKTVATLANEDKFVSDYEKAMTKPTKAFVKKIHIIGFVFGLSQFIQFGVIGALFYAGAYFHIEYGGKA